MRPRHTITALAAAALLVLAGCGADDDGSAPGTAPAEETAPVEETRPAEKPTDASPEATKGAEPTEDGDAAADSELVLTVAGDEQVLEPTDVYCSGDVGNIRHIIGKTNNQLPIVEAKGTEFAMVKTGPGKPYRMPQPAGISYGEDSVTFDGTELGAGAVLDGTMTCTAWEDCDGPCPSGEASPSGEPCPSREPSRSHEPCR